MNEHLSIQRLGWLLRADIAAGYRSLLTVSAALAGVILIASLISFDVGDRAQGFFTSWYGGMLFIWGIIASSRAFRELHDKTGNQAYLLLPASALEKTAARLLAVTLGLVVYLLVFTTAVSILVQFVFLLMPGAGYGLFNPLDPQLWPMIGGYFFLQSFFFLGAAWFRSRHFIKTTLVLTVVGIGLIVFATLTLNIAFSPGDIADIEGLIARASGSYRGLLRSLQIVQTIFTILLPAACWSIAWLRLTEAQVSDAV